MDRKQRARHLAKVSAITLNEEVVDQDAKNGQATQEKKRASFIADGIAKNIFSNGGFIHAINNIVYNDTNGSILLILFPVANDNIDGIIDLVKEVRGVKRVEDNPINDEVTMTSYHVLKVIISEEQEVQDEPDDELPEPEGEEEITTDGESPDTSIEDYF